MTARPKLVGIYVLRVDRHDGDPFFYIGQTIDFYTRVSQHLRALRRADHGNVSMGRAFKRYGEAAFSFQLILEVEKDRDALTQTEQTILDNYVATFGHTSILNAMLECVASHVGVKRRPETLAKMSAAQKGRKRTPEQNEANRQRALARPPMSEETRRKISESSKGRAKSPEHQAAWDAARTGENRLRRLREGKAASTYSHSEETRNKIAASLTGRVQSAEFVEKRISKIRGRKQTPEEIAKRVVSRRANKSK